MAKYAKCITMPFILAMLLLVQTAICGLPPGFVEEPVIHLHSAIEVNFAMKADNSGFFMFSITKSGLVYIAVEDEDSKNQFRQQLALDLKDKTCSNNGFGMMSVTPHPEFNSNHWIYVYYSHINSDGNCDLDPVTGPRFRLSRFTVQGTDGDGEKLTIDPETETVLLQTVPMVNTGHFGGDMAFGNDGYLYLTIGDNFLSAGGGTVSQDLSTLFGSMVRISGDDGSAPSSNPFLGSSSGSCRENGRAPRGKTECQEIFAYGLRNPFRFVMDPNTPKDKVQYLISDVGDSTYEEVNAGGTAHAGVNYGYPLRSGPCSRRGRPNCTTPQEFEDPLYWYPHPPPEEERGAAIVGIEIPKKGVWPDKYDDSMLYIEYVDGVIYHTTKDDSNACRSCDPPRPPFKSSVFHDSVPRAITLQFGPYFDNRGRLKDGALYFVHRDSNRPSIRRIVYMGGNNSPPEAVLQQRPPVAAISVNSPVTFDASDSFDPDNDDLKYDWTFGDGTGSIEDGSPIVEHSFSERGEYDVKVTVSDSEVSVTATLEVRVGIPPTAVIEHPKQGATFSVGDIFTVVGSGRDSSGNDLPASSLSWEVRQHHNVHYHPFLSPTSGNRITLPPAPGPEDFLAATNSYLEIILTVTDPDGISTTVSKDVMPNGVYLDFDSDPTGLDVSLDGTMLTMPQRVLSWENHQLQLHATDQGKYKFLNWSDGGDPRHLLDVPSSASDSPTKYVASFATTVAESDMTSTTAEIPPTSTNRPVETPVPTTTSPMPVGDNIAFTCSEYDEFVNYRRMCFSNDPCCEPVRSDTGYCWNIYDNIFPGDLIRRACSTCCKPGKTVGDPSPPLPGIPHVLKCSDLSVIGNTGRICSTCCLDSTKDLPVCIAMRNQMSEDDIHQVCHYCCRQNRGG